MSIAASADLPTVRTLFREYAESLGIDLSFQHFNEELAALPGYYDVILVAHEGGEAAGCVALRRLDDETCEMKRLYIHPRFRGRNLGRALVTRIIEEARSRTYLKMRLDTLPSMTSAIALYESLGFVDIAPYRFNPVEGTRFLELTL